MGNCPSSVRRKLRRRHVSLTRATRTCHATTTDLRRLLYTYFSTYGKVLDVIAMRTDSMRGQAFVVFRDLTTSTAALRREDGRVFAGQPMRISYARSKSYATIEKESGKEALYQFRLGISKNPEAARKITFSGAGTALEAAQNKRSAVDDAVAGLGGDAKRARTDGDGAALSADEGDGDDAMEVESDDDDE